MVSVTGPHFYKVTCSDVVCTEGKPGPITSPVPGFELGDRNPFVPACFFSFNRTKHGRQDKLGGSDLRGARTDWRLEAPPFDLTRMRISMMVERTHGFQANMRSDNSCRVLFVCSVPLYTRKHVSV